MRIKSLFLGLTSLALVAGPASAQTWRPSPGVQRQIQADINQLASQIQRSQQRGVISAREGQRLRRDALQVQRTFNRFRRNGIDRSEARQLEVAVNQVRRQLRLERRDWDGRRN